MQLNFDGHYIDDPLDVVNAKPDFSDMGLQMQFKPMDFIKQNPRLADMYDKHHDAVFADFDRTITHYARVHNLHQDEISLLLMAWFNKQPGCIKANIQWIQQNLTKEQYEKLFKAAKEFAYRVGNGFDFELDSDSNIQEVLQEELIEPIIEPLINGRL